MSKPKLPFYDLALRHQGVTGPIGESYTEAARVCLDRHHRPPVDFEIDNSGARTNVVAEWEQADARTRGAWANDNDATEFGAYACTLAAVELTELLDEGKALRDSLTHPSPYINYEKSDPSKMARFLMINAEQAKLLFISAILYVRRTEMALGRDIAKTVPWLYHFFKVQRP